MNMFKMMSPKKTAALGIASVLAVSTVGVGGALVTGASLPSFSSVSTQENEMGDSTQALKSIQVLEDADRIVAHKRPFTFYDQWDITVDGVEVAHIKGEYFKMLTDTYVMRDLDGNVMGAEEESIPFVTRSLSTFDHEGNKNGFIDQEFNPFLMTLKVIKDGESVGKAEQQITLFDAGKISLKDGNGDVEWDVDRNYGYFAGNEVVITRQNADEVDAMDAVWVAVVFNEIMEAKENNRKSN